MVVCTCTGCAMLCEDIELIIENNEIKEIFSACRIGVSRFVNNSDRIESNKGIVNGETVDIDKAINKAKEILNNSENTLLFGLANSTLEAQKKGIELAKKYSAYLDDTSSFCQGITLDAILKKKNKIKTCTLDDVRNKADLIIYWGADPANSHPRHLSKYSYFPRGELRQRGWEEERTMITIDVRESHTATICKEKDPDYFYEIPPHDDHQFINALLQVIDGTVPKYNNIDKKRLFKLYSTLKKAEFGVIFVGLGLVHSIKNNFDILLALLNKLNAISEFYLIPMVGHYNMRGFNQTLFETTGYINRVKFDGNEVKHGVEYSVIELLKNKSIDAMLCIGSDPYASLPRSIFKDLDIKIIVINPVNTLTSKFSEVVIPSAFSGIEGSGTAIRMDGVKVELQKVIDSQYLSDEEIIDRLISKG